jgi:hypothetical protein
MLEMQIREIEKQRKINFVRKHEQFQESIKLEDQKYEILEQ